MTKLKPGNMHEIADQMLKTQLQIITLQEIKWKGSCQIKKDKYSLYYSCAQQNTGQLGTGFMVKREIAKNIISFQPYNEKICKLRMRGKYFNLTLINVQTPTKQFYDDLQRVYESTAKHDVLIILGDLNAKIGKEQAYSQVSRMYILHNSSN
jgi:exonuclease III